MNEFHNEYSKHPESFASPQAELVVDSILSGKVIAELMDILGMTFEDEVYFQALKFDDIERSGEIKILFSMMANYRLGQELLQLPDTTPNRQRKTFFIEDLTQPIYWPPRGRSNKELDAKIQEICDSLIGSIHELQYDLKSQYKSIEVLSTNLTKKMQSESDRLVGAMLRGLKSQSS